jgi:hypothetical protein
MAELVQQGSSTCWERAAKQQLDSSVIARGSRRCAAQGEPHAALPCLHSGRHHLSSATHLSPPLNRMQAFRRRRCGAKVMGMQARSAGTTFGRGPPPRAICTAVTLHTDCGVHLLQPTPPGDVRRRAAIGAVLLVEMQGTAAAVFE